ncbi:MAG: hypothetical protein KDA84_24185 [Planctomycetaceae bacterium]|nr:hypothetical protein [Planctomycetaceae bacterium]
MRGPCGQTLLDCYGRQVVDDTTFWVSDQEHAGGLRKEGDSHPLGWIWKSEKDNPVPLYLMKARWPFGKLSVIGL